MVSNLFDEYAKNAAEIKALEAKQDQLKPFIIEMMIAQGQTKVETSLGKFTRSIFKKWTYPQGIIEMNEELKAAKAKAESTGEAELEEVESLRFTAVKL